MQSLTVLPKHFKHSGEQAKQESDDGKLPS